MDKRATTKVGKRNDRQRMAMGFNQAAASKGLIVQPEIAIIISLVYIGVVIILHMIGKFRKDNTAAPTA